MSDLLLFTEDGRRSPAPLRKRDGSHVAFSVFSAHGAFHPAAVLLPSVCPSCTWQHISGRIPMYSVHLLALTRHRGPSHLRATPVTKQGESRNLAVSLSHCWRDLNATSCFHYGKVTCPRGAQMAEDCFLPREGGCSR